MNNEYRDIISFDGTVIRCLIRETGNSKWLIVTHGLGEHLGRHEYMLKLFAGNFNIAIYDLRGHGKSGGKRAWVENFNYFLKDLQMVLNYLKKEFGMSSHILFGHSMGGLITAAYMQNLVTDDLYPEKVYLSSPAVAGSGFLGQMFNMAPMMLMDLLVKAPTVSLEGVLDLKRLSHDTRVYESYIKDELNELKIHSKLFLEILKTGREVFSRPLRISCPLFVSIGTEDTLVNPQLLIRYFTKIEKNAQLKVFEGGYHELHNEIEKYRKPYLHFLRESFTGQSFDD